MQQLVGCDPPAQGLCKLILDFIQENKSEMQPDTIHVDTQGQSTAIFGLGSVHEFRDVLFERELIYTWDGERTSPWNDQ